MNTSKENKIIEAITLGDLRQFEDFINNKGDVFKENYSSLINAMLHNKKVDFLSLTFKKFPDFALAKNSKGYNIAHIIALKNYKWAIPLLNILPDSVFYQKDKKGFNPFHTACATTTDELWKAFINHHTTDNNMDNSNILGVTPFHLAVYSNNPEKIDDLINKGFDLNKAGSGVIDLALEQKNWDMIGSIVNNVEIISSKFALEAVKDFPKSESAIQAFIDDHKLQSKIFPLQSENQLPVWSYFFYYIPWSFLKKNEEFVKERFLTDLVKNPDLTAVAYSCMLGKRNALKKLDWLMNNSTKFKWKNIGIETINNVSTFGKDMPTGHAAYFDKFSKEELLTLMKSPPQWFKNIEFTDLDCVNINIALLLQNAVQDVQMLSLNKSIPDRETYNKFKRYDDQTKDKGELIQALIDNKISKLSNNVIRENMTSLTSFCNKFKIVSTRLYEPLVDDLKASVAPLEYFQKTIIPNNEQTFLTVIVKKLLSNEEDKIRNNEVLELFSNHKGYSKALNTAIFDATKDSNSNVRSKYKIKNFDFPANIQIAWNKDDFISFELSEILNFIGCCNYSKESIKLLDKLNSESKKIFEEGTGDRRKRFNYKTLIKDFSFKSGINQDFIEAIEKLNMPNTQNGVYAYIVLLGKDSVEDKAYANAIAKVTALDKDTLNNIIVDFSHTDICQSNGMIELLKIAKEKEIDLPSSFWQNWDTLANKDIKFYNNALSAINDFSYYFEYIPLGVNIDTFKEVVDSKTPELDNYFKTKGVSDWVKSTGNFQTKDAIFMGVYLLDYGGREICDIEFEKFKSLINKDFTKDLINNNSLLKELQAKETVNLLYKNNFSVDKLCNILQETELKNYSGFDWFDAVRSDALKVLISLNMSNFEGIPDNSNEDDISIDFKI